MSIFLKIGRIFRQSSTERLEMITKGDLLSTFMLLSVPGILMMVIQMTTSIVDGMMVYVNDSSVSGAAISYTATMQNVFIMGGQGLSAACSALIGRENGAGNRAKAKSYAGQLIALTFFVGLFFIPVTVLVGSLLASNLEPNLQTRIMTYNTFLALCFPLILIQSTYNSIKNVFGHPELTFMRALLFMPTKLFFTYLFVNKLGMGVNGAGLSSLCSYSLVTLFIVKDLFFAKSEERITRKDMRLKLSDLKIFMVRSWPAVIQNSLKSLGFFVIKMETTRFGPAELAAQSISGDVTNIFQGFTACYDVSIIPMVSSNVGAGQSERAKKAAFLAVKIGFVSSIFLSLLCILLGPMVVTRYTSDPQIIHMAKYGCYIMAAGFSGFSVMFNEMPVFIGLGLNKASLLIQTLRIWVIRMAALYFMYAFFPELGIYAIFISATIANIAGAIISHIVFLRAKF